MISPDEFYRQTNENFKTVFSKIDDVKSDVSDLKGQFDTHIAVGEALEKVEKSNKIPKAAKVGLLASIIPIGLIAYNLIIGF